MNRNAERDLHRAALALGERRVYHRGISPGIDGAVVRRHASGKAINRLELVELLSAASPALALKQRSHARSFGCIVPHVFLAEVLSRIGDCLGPAAQFGDHAEAEALLAAVERAIERGDRETKELVARCFARESCHQPFFGELKPLAGPRLRALLRTR
jgi:hypothetical protein